MSVEKIAEELGILKKLLKMTRSPEEEAVYLTNQFHDEAFQIAIDCLTLFHEFNKPHCAEYWYCVCCFISPNSTQN